MTFASGIKIKVGDGETMTRFWREHWVGDATLASLFPNLFLIAMDSSSTTNTQTCLFQRRMICAPQFRMTYQHLANDLNNLLTILQPVTLSTDTPDVCQ